MTEDTLINVNAPKFTPDDWDFSLPSFGLLSKDWRGANCFRYAFAGSNHDGSNKIVKAPTEPGETSGYKLLVDDKVGIDPGRLVTALHYDGIEFAPKSAGMPQEKEGHYVVGIYLGIYKDKQHPEREYPDYHFVRQDADGGLSSKAGIAIPVERFVEPPADGTVAKFPEKFYDKYHLIGYAYAPKEGVKLGIEESVAIDIVNCKKEKVEDAFFDRHHASLLYKSIVDNYGENLTKCGVTGGDDVTVADYLSNNFSVYKERDVMRNQAPNPTRR